MTEAQYREVEQVLLCIGDAKTRAGKARSTLRSEDAGAHVVEALAVAERELDALYRQLMQGTYYAIP